MSPWPVRSALFGVGKIPDFIFISHDLYKWMFKRCSWFTIVVSHSFLVWSKHLIQISLIRESPLLKVGLTQNFMTCSHELIPFNWWITSFWYGEDTGVHVISSDITSNMSLRKQERKMREHMFKGSYGSKSLRISIININTNGVLENNGQSQILLAYNDYLYEANKGK